jgi:ABC-type transporter Mla maintaining outer membrane lipid asymmetry ATPase subunit MlaF
VFDVADNVILLYGGRVVEQGTKESVRASLNPFTRQFIHGAVTGPLAMD